MNILERPLVQSVLLKIEHIKNSYTFIFSPVYQQKAPNQYLHNLHG